MFCASVNASPYRISEKRTTYLLRAVRLYVSFGGMLGVLGSVRVVAMRRVCMVGGFFVVARCVMLGGFAMMACRMLMMLSGLVVVMGCFL